MSKWDDKLALYDKIVDKCKDFERKGKNMIFTSANGYMFTLLNKDAEIGIRLSKEDQKKFVDKHGGGPYKSYGATMRDYVLVPEDMHSNVKLLAKYFQQSYDYVMTLEPK